MVCGTRAAPRLLSLSPGRLVKAWFKEHCPPNLPVKVRVSYQKLLKLWVLTELYKKRKKPSGWRNLFGALR